MSDFLNKIVLSTRSATAHAAASVPLAVLRQHAETRRDFRGFAAALASPHSVRIIAEIKRASPSKGNLRINLDPAKLARAYEAGGAAAISVLTERAFFKGSPEDLAAARKATRLPVLRKDFILDEYQVYESAAMGADAILLIVRLLTDLELSNLYHLARKLGLDVLVEVYDDADAVRARNLGARLIAINNRDLTSFDTDVTRSHRLSSLLTPGTIIVAASGIAEASDIRRTLGSGINRFLIGESLVHAEYPIRLLQALNAIHPIEIKICGITDPETAAMCAAAGASAIGMVFYPPSPRNVSLEQARAIAAQIPFGVAKTGVFADQDADTILRIAFESGLDVAQLHRSSNRIPPELFTARGLPVVMALNLSGDALLEYVRRTPFDTGILVECGQGPLPGGNGQEWRWADAAVLRGLRPFAVAGGLTPENVVTAITESGATAVDVSSSVEQSPGVKDFGRVREFIAAARSVSIPQSSPVFWRPYPTISNLST